jgi:flagellar biosynthetic protein FliR
MSGAILVTGTELINGLTGLFPAFIRIAAMLMIAPVFGAQNIPARIRLVLALVLTAVVAPLLPSTVPVDPLSASGVLILGQQILIGVTIGFSVQLIFAALTLAGQTTAMGMGLGFASMVDPQNGVQVPVVGQYYLVVATLLFLAMNGHLALIRVLVDSFEFLPVGSGWLGGEDFRAVAYWGARMFGNAVLVALPAVTSILLVNLSFGVVSRAAPQLNIFGVGFPIVMMLGFVTLIFALSNLVPQLEQMLDQSLEAAAALGRH